MNRHTTGSAAVLVAVASAVAMSAPAQARGTDKVGVGTCTASSASNVKVGLDNGLLRVEGEVDSNVVGQTWAWRVVHNGTLAARGSALTAAPSGAFAVRRLLTNAAGTDRIAFRAVNPGTGEACTAVVAF